MARADSDKRITSSLYHVALPDRDVTRSADDVMKCSHSPYTSPCR